MINSKKIVVVTPAGRRRYMEILFRYILRERDIIDEYRIWVNTKDLDDIKYFEDLEKEYEGFVVLDRKWMNESQVGSNTNIHHFFKDCVEIDTLYIRLDDDVVWLTKDFIKNLAKFRIENPDPFLIYPTIINNSICDYLLQRQGYYKDIGEFGYHCIESIAFREPHICEAKHREMFNHILDDSPISEIPKWTLLGYERVSINCISWLGKTFAQFNGEVGIDEEQCLSVDKPKSLGIPNMITNVSACSHFAFGPQRLHMDKTDILQKYKSFSMIDSELIKNHDFTKHNWKDISLSTKMKIYQILNNI
jgi:hypothetical protein